MRGAICRAARLLTRDLTLPANVACNKAGGPAKDWEADGGRRAEAARLQLGALPRQRGSAGRCRHSHACPGGARGRKGAAAPAAPQPVAGALGWLAHSRTAAL